MRTISIYERFGLAIEQQQQNAEALTVEMDNHRETVRKVAVVLAALKTGKLRLDQIDVDAENGHFETFPDRPAPAAVANNAS